MERKNTIKCYCGQTVYCDCGPKKQKTAVDSVIHYVMNTQHFTVDRLLDFLYIEVKNLEKEQLIDAHIEGQRVFDKHPHSQWTTDQAEEYYNKTYEK